MVVALELVEGGEVDVNRGLQGWRIRGEEPGFVMLNPSDSVVDWVLKTVPGMGAGWCPPGMLGIGIGGTAEKAMVMAEGVPHGSHRHAVNSIARLPQN